MPTEDEFDSLLILEKRFEIHRMKAEFRRETVDPSGGAILRRQRVANEGGEWRTAFAKQGTVNEFVSGTVDPLASDAERQLVEVFDRFAGEPIDVGATLEFGQHAGRGLSRAAGHDGVVSEDVPIAAQFDDAPLPFQGDAFTVGQDEIGTSRHGRAPEPEYTGSNWVIGHEEREPVAVPGRLHRAKSTQHGTCKVFLHMNYASETGNEYQGVVLAAAGAIAGILPAK